MAIYCRGSNVAEIYRRGTKVLQVYKKGALVYDAGGGEAFGGYIREGLVLQLDCRRNCVDTTDEDGNAITSWEWMGAYPDMYKELGLQYPHSISNKVVPHGKDGVVFDGESHFTDGVPRLSEIYVEVCFEYSNAGVASVIYGSSDSGERFMSSIAVDGNKICSEMDTIYHFPPSASYIIDESSGLTSISAMFDENNEIFFVNGVDKSGELSSDYFFDESHRDVFEENNIGYGLIGKIYSIRIYNHVLKQEEREHNYAMDEKNFDHSVPTNAVLLNGGEPIQLFGGDYVELNK